MAVQHKDNTGGRGPSPAIFGRFTRDQVDYNDGIRFKTDFMSLSGLLTSTAGQWATDGGGFTTYQAASTTVKQISSLNSVITAGGILENLTPATDNIQVGGEFGDGNGGLVVPTSGTGGAIGFEARIYINQANLSTIGANFYIGLATPGKGSGAAGIIDTSDALVTSNYNIGMWVLHAAPTALKAGWINASGTTTKGTLATITFQTWYKIGFLYTPSGVNDCSKGTGDMLQWFVNGAEVLSLRSSGSTIDANFPTGLALSPAWEAMTNGSNAAKLDIDWIQCWAEPQTNG
jgi:hypothetical protein